MKQVSLSHVGKTYGGVDAVHDFSLTVKQGELVALLGPSGCGKTTTLRMIAGFVLPTAGEIRIGQHNVTEMPPYRRSTGMVFQNYALFPHMTVSQNVGFGLEMRNVARADIKARVLEMLRLVHLDHLLDRYPRQLSGGQQQRVALARALAITPDVLLLDEPLSNLDAKLRHAVRIEIRQLQRKLGLTTIFVTHDQEEALAVADRLVVMNKGRIEQVGTPRELYDSPRTAFIADFMGRANFLRGYVSAPGTFQTQSGQRFYFSGSAPSSTSILSVRPDCIDLVPGDAAAKHPNVLSGIVRAITFLGPVIEVMIGSDTGQTISVHCRTASHDIASLKEGEPVRISWPVKASQILDASDWPDNEGRYKNRTED